jgi:hypothetical protein
MFGRALDQLRQILAERSVIFDNSDLRHQVLTGILGQLCRHVTLSKRTQAPIQV